MTDTAWIRPSTLAEALQVREQTHARPLAGATDLYVRYRATAGTVPRIGEPATILYLGHLPEMTAITVADTPRGPEQRIGAAAVYTDIAAHEATPEILRRTIAELAAPALRNVGTLGGNIGNASPAADAVCTLYALHAEVELSRSDTVRRVPIGEVITGPAATVVRDDELITAVFIPLPREEDTPGSFHYYRKVGTRRANALSKIALAGCGCIREGILTDLGVAIGAAGPTVISSPDLETLARGADRNRYESIREELRYGYSVRIAPISDQRSTEEYRRLVVENLLGDFFDRHVPEAFGMERH